MQCDCVRIDILGNNSPVDEVGAEATLTACIISGRI